MFWRCLYTHARIPARILWVVRPKIFADELDLIEVVGTAESFAELSRELASHRYHYPPRDFFRRELAIRVSGKKLARLASKVMGQT
ncbi:MAG: hypothetical protein WCO56_18855 [Verrucomicrobiota bacterium]